MSKVLRSKNLERGPWRIDGNRIPPQKKGCLIRRGSPKRRGYHHLHNCETYFENLWKTLLVDCSKVEDKLGLESGNKITKKKKVESRSIR